MIMLWHSYPHYSFTGPEKFLEMDIQLPPGYVSGCTAWTDLPRPYDDCPTGGTLEAGYEAWGFGSYGTDQIYSNRWYTARYTFTRTQATATTNVAKVGWQETKMGSWCGGFSYDPWCLTSHAGGRLHTGVTWRQNQVSKSSWVTPEGYTAPRDYPCDWWHDTGCRT
jgi:hypothetical protein